MTFEELAADIVGVITSHPSCSVGMRKDKDSLEIAIEGKLLQAFSQIMGLSDNENS
jgi:hypothetical protein